MYDKTKVFPIREPEGGGGGGGDVTAAGNNTFTGVNTFENNVNLGKSDSIITVNGTLKDGGGNEYVTTTDVATKNSTGVVQIGDYIDVDENGVISSNDTRKASIEDLKDGTLVPKLADNMTPYAEDSGTTQTQPFFLEGTATGNGESRVDAKQVPAYALLQEKRGNMVRVNQLADCQTITASIERNNISSQLFTYYPTHTYLCCFDYKIEANIGNIRFLYGVWNNSLTEYARMLCPNITSLSGRLQFIFVNQTGAMSDYSSVKIILQMLGTDISETNKVTTSNVAFVDLTQWFNGNIPAYLLSHPEAFGRYYKGSLAYEPGRLEPATGRYLTSVGRNIWDEEWEVGNFNTTTGAYIPNTHGILSKNRIRCLGYTEYYGMCGTIGVDVWAMFYDIAGNVIELPSITSITSNNVLYVTNRVFTTPATAYEMKFYATSNYGDVYKNDITISLYYSGESGYDQYYPYEVLATIDTGTESLYSAGSAYDSKVPSGLITRRIGSGNLTGLYFIWDGVRWYANAATLGIKLPASNNDKANILHGTLMAYPINSMATDSSKLGIGVATNGNIYVYNNDSTASPTGTIYFELAEPTTEQGTPFQENVPIDDFGQLSWSNTDVPQGNQIFYPVDYKAYLDTLMKRTNGDATSLVRKTDYPTVSVAGVVKMSTSSDSGYGIYRDATGLSKLVKASNQAIKIGQELQAVTPTNQHQSVFYGLAKAAGANLASSTAETAPDGTNPGVYPAAAKSAIQDMLGITDLIGDINTVLDSVNGVVI